MADGSELSKEARNDRIREIWFIGMAELHAKMGLVDFWRYYEELSTLKRRPLSPEWLEATIAMGVIGQIRPAKAIGFLKKLREQREKRDQLDKFEAFDRLIRDYLYPLRLTNHGFGQSTFADVDHQTIWEQVRQHLSALSELGYDVFLNSGTLLGVIREQKLIDHDDDIDLALILKADNVEDAADEWQELRETLKDLGLFDEDNFNDASIYKLTPAGNVQIDLFPAWIEDGRMYVYPHTHGVLAAEDVLPLKVCELTGHALPADPEKMLEVNYGPGWRSPDPLFKFPWAKACREFKPFRRKLTL